MMKQECSTSIRASLKRTARPAAGIIANHSRIRTSAWIMTAILACLLLPAVAAAEMMIPVTVRITELWQLDHGQDPGVFGIGQSVADPSTALRSRTDGTKPSDAVGGPALRTQPFVVLKVACRFEPSPSPNISRAARIEGVMGARASSA